MRKGGDDDDKKMNEQNMIRNMLNDTMVVIDKSIQKINNKLDGHNEAEWNKVDQMVVSIAVRKLFWENRNHVSDWRSLTKSLCNKYESVLAQRISQKVVPSIEKVRSTSSLLDEIVEQWLLFDIYRRNLEIIFETVGEIQHIITNVFPMSLYKMSKIIFCKVVWKEFHVQIDHLLTRKIDEGAFRNVDDNLCFDNGTIKLNNFYHEMKHIQEYVYPQLPRTFAILTDKNIVHYNI
ncbi:hypothetical protein CsatB_029642 [Cannabis sativa]